jgi:hypothetical protein
MISMIFYLLILYQLKHFLCDYPLQTPRFFIGKFRKDWSFFVPLLAHSAIHGVGTFLIAVWATGNILLGINLGILDMVVHGTMDRLKAGERWMGRWKALSSTEFATATPAQLRGNALFWNALGVDQMVHHLTHYLCIYLILKS